MPQEVVEPMSQRLTNEDFRKLLQTPRATPAGGSTSGHHASGSIREAMANASKDKPVMGPPSERTEARRKKKNFYANLKKQEDNKLQELQDKYRDRARERRDGANPDYQNVETPGHTNSAYRAVAPDMKSGIDAAERRRRMIQESKFLGGDMEHTHLVKGLDYALLQKVRSEIVVKEVEQEKEMEKIVEEAEAAKAEIEEAAAPVNDEPEFKSVMGRNIHNIVSSLKSRQIIRNELFAPSRMAYVIDLDDENMETDIPTTLVRSKAEVPVTNEDIATLTTNDIVINKLAQILSYLRAGGRGKKNKKRDKDKPLFNDIEDDGGGVGGIGIDGGKRKNINENIYDDIGDYRPERRRPETSKYSSSNRDRGDRSTDKDRNDRGGGDRDRDRGRDKYRDYNREKDRDYEREYDRGDYDRNSRGGQDRDHRRFNNDREMDDYNKKPRSYFGSKPDEEQYEPLTAPPPPQIKQSSILSKFANEPEGYAECYPGLEEMNDAIDDSDDEVDYTKMDLGNKKGPIGRWDFDTQEEYSDYMSTKEALPKAAFQYGVKMQDGRKTRKHKTEKSEKAELDREWQKIQNIIQKRKTKGGDDEPDYKVPKY